MQQAMYIGDFVNLVHRNAVFPNVRFITRSGNSQAYAPAETCTLLAGAWLPVIKSDYDPIPKVNEEHIGTWNVPLPWIPEYTIEDENGRIVHRGWKGLLQLLLIDHVIRPTSEIIKLLGDDWNEVRRSADIRCY